MSYSEFNIWGEVDDSLDADWLQQKKLNKEIRKIIFSEEIQK